MTEQITLFHFNDVYHIKDIDRVSKFAQHLRMLREDCGNGQQATIFSGDVFSPSLEASILKGEHMTTLLNQLGIDLACYGNHDFDFGEARLAELNAKTAFPWLLSNVIREKDMDMTDESSLLAGSKGYAVRTFGDCRVGFLGLAGTDWPSNCQHLPACNILAPVKVARDLARHLRTVERCDIVIALTHMRLAEDLEVSDATSAAGDDHIDLLLGGHDHEVLRRYVRETDQDPSIMQEGSRNEDILFEGKVRPVQGPIRVVKSGSDFNSLSKVELNIVRDSSGRKAVRNVKLDQIADLSKLPGRPAWLEDHDEIVQNLLSVHASIKSISKQPLLHTKVDLEGRGAVVRSEETNLGNLLADASKAYHKTQIAFINSGGIRCNRTIPKTVNTGRPLSVRDIIDISPFDNALVVKRVDGHALREALENSISDAHTDGRFLQMSGMRIVADWRRPEGSRLLGAWITENGAEEVLEDDRSYTVAMVSFVAEGFDGYSSFKDQETLIGEEGAITDTNLLLQVLGYNQGPVERQSAEHDISANEDKVTSAIQNAREAITQDQSSEDDLAVVCPRVQGRITFVDSAAYAHSRSQRTRQRTLSSL